MENSALLLLTMQNLVCNDEKKGAGFEHVFRTTQNTGVRFLCEISEVLCIVAIFRNLSLESEFEKINRKKMHSQKKGEN